MCNFALRVLDHDPPTVADDVSKLTVVNLDTYLIAVLSYRQRYPIAPESLPSPASRDFRSVVASGSRVDSAKKVDRAPPASPK